MTPPVSQSTLLNSRRWIQHPVPIRIARFRMASDSDRFISRQNLCSNRPNDTTCPSKQLVQEFSIYLFIHSAHTPLWSDGRFRPGRHATSIRCPVLAECRDRAAAPDDSPYRHVRQRTAGPPPFGHHWWVLVQSVHRGSGKLEHADLIIKTEQTAQTPLLSHVKITSIKYDTMTTTTKNN